MKNLITNAALLTFAGSDAPRAGAEMGSLGLVRNGALLMDGETIAAVGLKDVVMKHPDARKGRIFDAAGRVVMPGFVDSHTHPVFGAARLKDFGLRARGKGYEEIAAQGGGIVSSINAVRGATEAELTERLLDQTQRFLECGTTTIEAKTGYGLDKDSELKALRAIKHVAAGGRLEIVPTFLGAHAVPPEYEGRPSEYVAMLLRDVLPVVVEEGLARYADAFCERGYFSAEDAETFLKACAEAGLGVKVHAEQLSHWGGTRVAARLKAVSADHLDHVDDGDLALMKDAGVIASLVPGSNQFLGMKDFPPARKIIDAGVPVALATDFNPGSCPCWNMQEILSIACTRMGMTPEEALTAATINGAYAAGLGKTHGSLETGKSADVVVMECEDPVELSYWFGANLAGMVFKKGRLVHSVSELRV